MNPSAGIGWVVIHCLGMSATVYGSPFGCDGPARRPLIAQALVTSNLLYDAGVGNTSDGCYKAHSAMDICLKAFESFDKIP